MRTTTEVSCQVCGVSGAEVRLAQCPVCHKRSCAEHDYRRSGKSFCSKACAEYYFYGDEEDD